ncbi:MAG: amino acid ABC transporter permease [Desulfovibrio sp.]|jgi:polar amino acid transport system permease protein|nr:amino acid ABC transporter permease [Desulfovibrio sp.]
MLTAEVFWGKVIPSLNQGLVLSLSLIIPSAIIGFLGGIVIGAVRVYAPVPFRRAADVYVALFRGVPLLLQLYFLYYALPKWGVRFSAYQAAVIGFVLCSSAYHSEYIRGALISIRQGQVKAAYSLGFSTLDMVLHIVIPQAVRRALPGCGNEVIYLIKYSSLAYVITFIELTGHAKELTARSFHYIEIYFTAGMYYLAMTTLATWLLKYLEKKAYVPGFGQQR